MQVVRCCYESQIFIIDALYSHLTLVKRYGKRTLARPPCRGNVNINTDLQYIMWLFKSVQEKVCGSYKHDNLRPGSINVEGFLTS
jgi:hypothetical protein